MFARAVKHPGTKPRFYIAAEAAVPSLCCTPPSSALPTPLPHDPVSTDGLLLTTAGRRLCRSATAWDTATHKDMLLRPTYVPDVAHGTVNLISSYEVSGTGTPGATAVPGAGR